MNHWDRLLLIFQDSHDIRMIFAWKFNMLYNEYEFRMIIVRFSCENHIIFSHDIHVLIFRMIFAWFSYDFHMKRDSHENYACKFSLCIAMGWRPSSFELRTTAPIFTKFDMLHLLDTEIVSFIPCPSIKGS